MLQYDPLQHLPTAEELPETDFQPVDNELQILIPNLLRTILAMLWSERQDWFFGVNMGLYYDPQASAIVPDAFLSLGVERRKSHRGRLSYVLWEEDYIVPLLALEVVSQTYGNEYDQKVAKYANIGILYYVIYNPDYSKRDQHEPLEVYRLIDGNYLKQTGSPIWMPEICLGIDREQGTYEGWDREWLYWYDQQGNRLLTPAEVAEQQRQLANQEQQKTQQERQLREELIARLRAKGVDPDTL